MTFGLTFMLFTCFPEDLGGGQGFVFPARLCPHYFCSFLSLERPLWSPFCSSLNLQALTFLFHLFPSTSWRLNPYGLFGAWIYSTPVFTRSLLGGCPELYVFTFSEATTEEIAVRSHYQNALIRFQQACFHKSDGERTYWRQHSPFTHDGHFMVRYADWSYKQYKEQSTFSCIILESHSEGIRGYKGYWMYANPLGRR